MKRLAKFDRIYDDALIYCPFVEDDVAYWYASGDREITIKLHDDTTVIYSEGSRGAKYIRPDSNRDDSSVDAEEQWRLDFAKKLHKEMWCSRGRLSELTGISERTISKYLNGQATPSAYNIKKIAQVLRCSPSLLIYTIEE